MVVELLRSAPDRGPRAAPPRDRPGSRTLILSTSSSRITGSIRPRTLHRVHELAGHGADVGASVAPDLRFVAHSAERDLDEGRSRWRSAMERARRGLADARGTDEAQDGALRILSTSCAHREVLEDALLDLAQAEVRPRRARSAASASDLAAPRGSAPPRAGPPTSRGSCAPPWPRRSSGSSAPACAAPSQPAPARARSGSSFLRQRRRELLEIVCGPPCRRAPFGWPSSAR